MNKYDIMAWFCLFMAVLSLILGYDDNDWTLLALIFFCTADMITEIRKKNDDQP